MSHSRLIAKISRFSLVGVAATLIYLIASNVFLESGMMPPITASVVAYILGMVVSFLGQSRFTFRVPRNTWGQFVRFCVLSAIGLIVSYASVYLAIEFLHIRPFWGTLATAVLIPILSFVVMNVWVFEPSER